MNKKYSSNEFDVDLDQISLNRKPGVSGMMRIRNDAEFISTCIESCISALDELIIVYNNCTDNSPTIIERMRQKYSNKIKVYHYEPKIIAWNLTNSEAENILSSKINSKNTLAGYYNYALSKTTYKYVMKIDADQIYQSNILQVICDAYRDNDKDVSLNIKNIIMLLLTRTLLSFSVRFGKYINILYKKSMIHGYHESLLKLIKIKKIPISLSGINTVIGKSKLYVSLGKLISSCNNIMVPFNGEGDHLIFQVKPGVKFIPTIDIEYNKLIGGHLNVIEKLIGTGTPWVWGKPLWIHLNACRQNIWNKTLKNFNNYTDYYCDIVNFFNSDYKKTVKIVKEDIFNSKRKKAFRFVFSSMDQNSINYFNKISDLLRVKNSYIFDEY